MRNYKDRIRWDAEQTAAAARWDAKDKSDMKENDTWVAAIQWDTKDLIFP